MTSIFLGGEGVKNLETFMIHNCEKSGEMGLGGIKKLCKFGDIIYGWPQIVGQHHSVVVLNGF